MKKLYIDVTIEVITMREDIIVTSGDNFIEDDWFD